MKKVILSTTIILSILGGIPLFASEGHSHGNKHDDISGDHGHGSGHDHDDAPMAGMFIKKKMIDAYNVHFHVMEANDDMRHGGTHNLMIKVEEGSKVLRNVKINSKVIYPNGKAESKGLMRMGDWYMNGYDLGHKGKHQLMILFKTADGEKHKGGVYYPAK